MTVFGKYLNVCKTGCRCTEFCWWWTLIEIEVFTNFRRSGHWTHFVSKQCNSIHRLVHIVYWCFEKVGTELRRMWQKNYKHLIYVIAFTHLWVSADRCEYRLIAVSPWRVLADQYLQQAAEGQTGADTTRHVTSRRVSSRHNCWGDGSRVDLAHLVCVCICVCVREPARNRRIEQLSEGETSCRSVETHFSSLVSSHNNTRQKLVPLRGR